MKPAEQVRHEFQSSERATHRLGDLITIAVVIAAGCERCTENAVQRALLMGCEKSLIDRTLGIVARLRSVDCLVRAVGPEVIARMERPLQAGKKVLQDHSTENHEGCGCADHKYADDSHRPGTQSTEPRDRGTIGKARPRRGGT